MKRILLSLMMVVATLASATAAETVIDCTTLTWAGVTEKAETIIGKSGDFTITINKETGATAPTQNPTSKDVRAYAKASILVECGNGTMTSVVFTVPSPGGTDVMGVNTVNNGTLVNDPASKTVTWTGSSSSFTITVAEKSTLGKDPAKNAQFRFTTVTAITGSATAVSDPTFSPKGGTFYEAQDVTINCATTGATIYYTTDGTTPTTASTTYTTPIVVATKGATVIKAIAIKAGLDNSTVSEATYTIADAPTMANIAAFLATNTTGTATGEVFEISSPVTVLYHGISKANSYLFVKDETGALQIFSAGNTFAQTYVTGDVIPAGVTGSVGFYGKVPQMLPNLDSFVASTSKVETKPMTTSVEEISMDMLNQLIFIKNATVGTKAITDETGTIDFYNRFDGIEIPTTTDEYNITAIANSYNGVLQIFPIKFDSSVGVTDATADATTIVAKSGNINISVANNATAIIFNAAGQVVAQKAIVAGENTIEVAGGFYIVKVGNTVAKVIVK